MMMRRSPPILGDVLLAGSLLGVPGAAVADADGPDFYRVTGLYPGAALTIHGGPGVTHRVLGWVPYNGVKLANMGCRGGMNIVEWEKATPAQRLAAHYRRWCKIKYKGTTGWVNGGYLRE